MADAEPWTILRLLTWTTQFLKDHGAESPRLDAEILLAEARGCRRIDLYTAFDQVPDETLRTRFRELVRKRAEGMPVAYLVGRREFYSLPFRVSPAVLIPRPETEHLLVRLLDLIAAQSGLPYESDGGEPIAPIPAASTLMPEVRLADVGAGSGILTICALKRFPHCRATAIDISAEALQVARENARQHGVADRIEFVMGDLLAAVPADATFDFVVSNPPYVSESEWSVLARDVRDFEPRGALVAGPRGTEVIERLVPQAADHLRPGGWLLTEISPMIEADVRRLIDAEPRFEAAATFKDLAGLARVVQARRK